MTNFVFCIPINSTSLGQASVAILREFYKKGISPLIFPIGGGVDLSAQRPDNDFNAWISSAINRAPTLCNRNNVEFRLWHTTPDSLQSFSSVKSLFYTFFELDQLTETEINILNQKDVVFASSKYTEQIFNDFGVKNVVRCELGFDSHNFKKTNKEYLGKSVTNFTISGKLEQRKNTLRILALWAKRFGNQNPYKLNCAIFNPFLNPGDQEAMIANALGGKRYWNIQFHPFFKETSLLSEFINASNIDLSGLSSAEGWNYGLFNSLAMGKQAVVLKAHSHLSYCNEKNSIFVNPVGMRPAYDGIFFHEGGKTNQGNVFEFSDDEAIAAMELAATRAHEPNTEGEKLRTEFTFEKTANIILESIQKTVN